MNVFECKPLPSTKPEHSYASLITLWRAMSIAHGFTLEEHLVGRPQRRLLCAKIGAHRREQVLISAGIHGDEPGAPWALLEIVNRGLLDPRYGYTIWCCVNPTGYERGTRESCDGIDINRTFRSRNAQSCEARLIAKLCATERYELVIDLHEDTVADGFYLYEAGAHGTRGSYGCEIVDGLRMSGHAIQQFTPGFDLGFSQSYLETSSSLMSGCVRFGAQVYGDMFETGTMLTTFLMMRARASRAFIFESPGTATWDERIAMHAKAVAMVLDLHGEHV